ncbi:MAG TPA: SurA N-terminal domain-containing protein [Terriglobales bacterium]|nr:SurA N-terminal domain-containing protein [Terriglobales bacterium]
MNRKFASFICAMLLVAGTLPCQAADVLDRIVATVNRHIILQSDWEAAIRYAALVDARPLDQLSTPDRKAALDGLIDQELLEEQLGSSEVKHATSDQVAQRIRNIRAQYPGAQEDQAWQNVLSRYGLTEKQLDRHVALQLDLFRLVDARFRPGVDIDARSIESYYNQELLPQLRQSGAKDITLAEVSPQIKELLTQQRVNELLVSWLQNLRSGSEIQTETSPSDLRDGSQ